MSKPKNESITLEIDDSVIGIEDSNPVPDPKPTSITLDIHDGVIGVSDSNPSDSEAESSE